MSRRPFRIQPGSGGLSGEAARYQRAASGANNPTIYQWLQNRRIDQGSEGGTDSSELKILDGGGDSGEFYAVEGPPITQPLDQGNAWNGPWVDRPNYLGIVALDEADNFSGGFGFNLSWQDTDNYVGVKASDDAETYADSATVAGLIGGSGWSGAWDV